MSRRPGNLLPGAVAWACLMFCLSVGGQEPMGAGPASLRTFFTIRSAAPDGSLPESLAGEFENDAGEALKSVSLDLNGDGKAEKFVLSAAPSVSGGRQWLVYDAARNVSRGIIIGTIIFIDHEAQDGFPALETYWKQGAAMAVVFRYSYSRGRYVRTHSRSMTVPEISDYFRSKPPLDAELELVEIKGPA